MLGWPGSLYHNSHKTAPSTTPRRTNHAVIRSRVWVTRPRC